MRSDIVATLAAGVSQIFAKVLWLLFGGLVVDMRASGLLLHASDPEVRIFCRMAMQTVLQDGGAHKIVWRCKGDAGMRLCMLCRNMFARNSGILDENGERL